MLEKGHWKRKAIKPKTSRCKDTVKIRVEIYEKEKSGKKTSQKRGFLKRSTKPANLKLDWSRKKKKTQIKI